MCAWKRATIKLRQWLQRDDRGSFRKWLLSLARNHAVDLLTQRATRSLNQDGACSFPLAT